MIRGSTTRVIKYIADDYGYEQCIIIEFGSLDSNLNQPNGIKKIQKEKNSLVENPSL